MVVKITSDYKGNIINQEKISDENPDISGLVDYYANKFVKLTEEREREQQFCKKKEGGVNDV